MDNIHGLNQGRARTQCVVHDQWESSSRPLTTLSQAATEYDGCPSLASAIAGKRGVSKMRMNE
ncbi:hypothetical protein BDQ94DRAFT_137953 [Aspergillus welwitschiae]|uniref:Uncharacterized protein n=1 Tax=Aspergillus welwitschiae TaxID=1341132 RepID=A0A3F3QCJ3_9EURO|nr:hypothetical protein BDQ94DRAFT_137953 [Aspergillus welwitschiae]RDH36522.1 hypothetical protein BDQ94DRAFT_137953 [Aspergillus welwitschiae]